MWIFYQFPIFACVPLFIPLTIDRFTNPNGHLLGIFSFHASVTKYRKLIGNVHWNMEIFRILPDPLQNSTTIFKQVPINVMKVME